jgi:hypothetical protein
VISASTSSLIVVAVDDFSFVALLPPQCYLHCLGMLFVVEPLQVLIAGD